MKIILIILLVVAIVKWITWRITTLALIYYNEKNKYPQRKRKGEKNELSENESRSCTGD